MDIDHDAGRTIGNLEIGRDRELERKQRNREYRVAARREKRNRKADEKKQRKLNATILRRMTRNPEKYNKNAERNRLRDIEMERRKIWQEAVRQAQRLAAIYDPSGTMFNVSPVITLQDGTVITQDAMRRRQERLAGKTVAEQEGRVDIEKDEVLLGNETFNGHPDRNPVFAILSQADSINVDRQAQLEAETRPPYRSKSQLKKIAKFAPKVPPPKPNIPNGIPTFKDEENWLSLWDLEDQELERRVLKEKRRKAAARKALRVRQQSGKAERRMARDEKRRVYRDLKLEWRAIKEETTREKTRLRTLEDQESKKIGVHVSDTERGRAMAYCMDMGFTLENTRGVDGIKPRAMGMRGVEVDFDAIEKGDGQNEIKIKANKKRVDLADVPEHAKTEYIPTKKFPVEEQPEEFIHLDVGEGEDFEKLNYNHKVRRKLRRAIEYAEIQKELLVRQRALDHLKERGAGAPALLQTSTKPVNVKGRRILDNGTLESAKQERVRARMDLTDFNDRMRVLRRQAREAAIFAGLRKHAEVSGKLPAQDAESARRTAQSQQHPDTRHPFSTLNPHDFPKTNNESQCYTESDYDSPETPDLSDTSQDSD